MRSLEATMIDPLADLSPVPAADIPSPAFAQNLRQRIEAIEARAASTATSGWHLAQLNLGVFTAPLDTPEMQEFANALDRINAIADASPGFVWRLTDADGGPSSNVEVPGADDPLLASNLSVWTGIDALRDFMYRTDHARYLRRRDEWFERDRQPMTVGWWIRAGTLPTLEDALQRLDQLRTDGPSDQAFPLRTTVPDPPTHETQEVAMTQTLIPYLAVSDARAALQFYAEVFGAEQSGELFEMDDGRIGHAEMTVGGATFYLADEFPEMDLYEPADDRKSPVAVVINVDDCDAVYNHAVAAGATGERPPADQHGHRNGWFIDPWGHRWSPSSQSR